MTLMAWLWIGLSILGAIILAAVVWLAGPLVAIGDAQPFDSVIVRSIIVFLILIGVGGAIAWRIISRRRAAAKIAEAMTETVADDSDAPVLKQKMEDALAVLKRTGKSNARALYDLPWYLIIGPPGAGKTTALVNSGLKFPLAADNATMAVQGVGGTRYCDWWFTEEAVLIDTAGRYTTRIRTPRPIAAAGSPSSTCSAGIVRGSRSTGSLSPSALRMFSTFRRRRWWHTPTRSESASTNCTRN